ncbi:hypothetical protein X793_03665 [Dehalococcoides mccartyi CG4]|uniref:hypothetical protein n=1 Tax=Dehalococcoides mccartyi TaxID=61435 RepID=UPI0004E09DF6|nr:hypothetical protein [Dehalococcoides mccartyi]AII59454.1 hypothetical protein X793_03665 [Dehalococcoides mccartyi CG4]
MNSTEEARYEQLRKLGQELHIPISETFWELEVRDKDGEVIQSLRQRSHSWVRNAYNHMFSQLAVKNGSNGTFGPGYLNVKDTSGTVRSATGPIGNSNADLDGTAYGCRGPAGDDSWGIQVGSGTNPESFEDYMLQARIANGVGAGQLSYIEQDPHRITYDPGTRVLANVMVRYFNNNSGADIDVNEVGLVMNQPQGGSTVYGKRLQARDKLASTVTVPNTGQLKVTYTIQLTYPA